MNWQVDAYEYARVRVQCPVLLGNFISGELSEEKFRRKKENKMVGMRVVGGETRGGLSRAGPGRLQGHRKKGQCQGNKKRRFTRQREREREKV
jgi:hypothetical protein